MRLCPGTNSPAPDKIEVINLPQTAPATPAAPATVITKETTKVQTVAGPTQYVKVPAKKAKSEQEGLLHEEGQGEDEQEGAQAGEGEVPSPLAHPQ